jgi:hypothetical protein
MPIGFWGQAQRIHRRSLAAKTWRKSMRHRIEHEQRSSGSSAVKPSCVSAALESSAYRRETSPLPHSGQNCRLCHFGMLAPQARQTITFVRMRTCQWPGPRSPRAARRGVRSLMRRGSGARLTGALAKPRAKTGRPSHHRGCAPLATRSRIRPCALSPAGRWRSGVGCYRNSALAIAAQASPVVYFAWRVCTIPESGCIAAGGAVAPVPTHQGTALPR